MKIEPMPEGTGALIARMAADDRKAASAEAIAEPQAQQARCSVALGSVCWGYDCYNHLSELPVESGGGMRSIDEILASVRHALETSEEFKAEYPPYTRIEITRYSSPNK